MDVVVVCDESNSIYPWEAVKNFLVKFVTGLDIGPKKTQVRTSKTNKQTNKQAHSLLLEKIMLDMKF